MDPILSVKNLKTKLKLPGGIFNVVDGLNFDLYPGKTLALVGESGSGKSMTALSIMRILPTPPSLPSGGEIIFGDKNLLEISEKEMRKIRGAQIAMIFQDPSSALNPVYTIGQQLVEVAELHLNLFGDDALHRAALSLKEVGIASPEERLQDYPHQLSGGMKQRVMIAMALMCEPKVLIADEPTTSLDVTIQLQVLELMRHLQQKMGMAILLITHDMGIVAEMADEVIVMYASQGVEKGPVDAIFDKRCHPYTIGLFNSRPRLKESHEVLTPIKGMVPSLQDYPAGCRFHPRCPFIMDKCCSEEVATFRVGEEHTVKCWLYDNSVESEKRLERGQVGERSITAG